MSGPGFVDGGTFSAAVLCLMAHVHLHLVDANSMVRLVLSYENMLAYCRVLLPLVPARADSGRNAT